ncbi:MAG: molybdopterin cofactor-binding domain-containing protein [Alphaproteobacteria bacterium]
MNGVKLPANLAKDACLDSWLRIDAGDTVTVFTGKAEIGQGIRTAIAQIAAEELDVAFERIRVVTADTGQTPNERITAGSGSVEESGGAMRQVTAEARHFMVGLAAKEWEVAAGGLTVEDGTIKNPQGNQQISYWELMAGKEFAVEATGAARPKPAADYDIVGEPVPRIDLPAKLTGEASFIQDMRLPDMVFARVVRPPSYDARLESLDDSGVLALAGVVKVVRDGRFLAVIAEREDQAVRAREKLIQAATWSEEANLPDEDRIFEWLITQDSDDHLVVDGVPQEGPVPPIEIPESAAETLEATYCRPYHMHASVGPSAAMAHLADGKMTVWTHSQGVYPLQAALAHALKMNADDIRTVHTDSAGCYGHNGADDAALDAALLAREVPGRPVLVQWMREDENAWEPYGPAMVIQNQASLDDHGRIIDWNHDVYSTTHAGRPRASADHSGLIAAWHVAAPMARTPAAANMGKEAGSHRNATPYYDFPRRRIVDHFIAPRPLRVSSLRGLGAYTNLFAIESFMDELAHAAGIDPVEFRLRNLSDERAKAVITAAAEASGWGSECPEGVGRGIAFNRYKNSKCYTAIVVELAVDRATGRVQLQRAVIAGDAGQIVNPDGLANQLDGGFIQAASWTLKERVSFDRFRTTSLDWEGYPILEFSEVPEIETVLLEHPDAPYLGSGEGTQGPTPAAIANAIFAATGVRMRELPFTPERVKRELG